MNQDPTAEQRKQDHIDLALASEIARTDDRFYYEPIMASHTCNAQDMQLEFLGKSMKLPLWVSSMTGGTQWAKTINTNLAKAANEFGLGMGLGSCRSLLYSDDNLGDFDVRDLIGDQALFANLGIAQLEEIKDGNEWTRVIEMLKKLRADGLIVHVNPLQEIAQPEGDRIKYPPIETIKFLLDAVDFPVIVKEVGQGMGYKSLEALYQLPLAAVDFAAHGGTNFTQLELMRSDNPESLAPLCMVGHKASEMIEMSNRITDELGDKALCKQIIVSGGIKDFLDGYHCIKKSKMTTIYGQAGAFLKHARGEYDALRKYVETQKLGLEMAYAFLQLKEEK